MGREAGFQFGADYILYRGPPDEFHAEHAVVVLDAEQPTQWWIAKTVATLAADVRKHLVLARVSGNDIFELVVDDAFARPADALAGRRRAPVQKAPRPTGKSASAESGRHGAAGHAGRGGRRPDYSYFVVTMRQVFSPRDGAARPPHWTT